MQEGISRLIIPLDSVVYDARARDGTWCTKKPRCMNFPECPNSRKEFLAFKDYKWFAVIEEFNILGWENQQREKHKNENWSVKQLRNPRHWQKGVRKRLKEKALKHVNFLMGDILLDIPEAHGVDVIRTMAKIGVKFEWGENAKVFRKVMLIGKPIIFGIEK